jgi:ABC-type transport system involved in cytochrome bd biosynthesis fused ATPase/permease subunit
MDGGRAAESGDHQTLIEQDGIYAELVACRQPATGAQAAWPANWVW